MANLNIRRWSIVTVVMLSLLMTSCLKNDDDTIILPPSMTEIPEAVLDADFVNTISHYMSIYEGDDAPDVEGKYLCTPMQMLYASDDYSNTAFYDIYMSFEGQNCRGLIQYAEKQNTAHLYCPYAYIIGSGDKFTLALTQRMTNEAHGWWCDVAIIISGQKTPQGIRNLQYAIAMKDKYDPHEVLMEKRGFRVYRDSDGLSYKHSWNPVYETNSSAYIASGKGGVK